MVARRLSRLTWACSVLLACGDPGAGAPQLCGLAAPLVGGSAQADILMLSPAQKRAIGRVWPERGPRGYFCTGVAVAPNLVLTAAHCDRGGALRFELVDEDEPSHVI